MTLTANNILAVVSVLFSVICLGAIILARKIDSDERKREIDRKGKIKKELQDSRFHTIYGR